MKQKPRKSPLRTRESLPHAKKGPKGIVLLCPFCTPPHPIVPGQPTPCGTTLRVMAVQEIIPARIARMEKLVCVKCKETGGGDMVRYLDSYVHLHDCAPGMRLLSEPPNYSRWAQLVYRLPERVRNRVETRTGIVQIVHEITPEGEETGKIQGYFFAPRNKVSIPKEV